MNEADLNESLRQLGRGAALPATFAPNVWREIRQRREAEPAGWGWLTFFLSEPRTVAACLCAALLLGIGSARLAGPGPRDKANAALELGVFRADSPALPATLLSGRL